MNLAKDIQHLLIVDDDARIRDLLHRYLVEQGYLVSSVKNAAEAESFLKEFKCDLMILDLMMPGENGIEFTNKLRMEYRNFIPIIMLTAMGEVNQRVEGLSAGADDYLVKPFEPKELLLRIANILKHKVENRQIFYFGNFSYNIISQSLTNQQQDIFLTNSEHSLLRLLLKNSNIIISREKLAKDLDINERSVDVKIVRLRSKIEANSSRPIFLQTIRSQGYIFRI